MTKKITGEFPEYCYKAFNCEEHAGAFIRTGTFRIGCLLSYTDIEDKSRCDPTEGTGKTVEPGIETILWVSPNPGEKAIVESKYGHVTHHINKYGNPMFCFCMSLPDADPCYMKNKFGKCVVKINDPRQLAEDIYDHYISEGQRILIEGCRVVYNKGQKLDRELTSNERLDLAHKQKSKGDSSDCEFRIVIIKFGEPCPRECRYLDGEVKMACSFKEIKINRPLSYLSLA